jgi:hypothetical protein
MTNDTWGLRTLCYNLVMKRLMLMLSLAGSLLVPVMAMAGPQASQSQCESANGVWLSVPVNGTDHCSLPGGHGLIIDYLLGIVRFLGGLIGLVVILMIIIGGIQYMTAGGNPKAVAAAKGRITGAITALVLYLLMFGILHYLIPGTF